jgi:hypothetical protein
MSDHLKANATRVWQDSMKREFESPRSFLWDDVQALEGSHGLTNNDGELIEWHTFSGPKTIIYFADGSTIVVMGKWQRWNERWSAYLAWA